MEEQHFSMSIILQQTWESPDGKYINMITHWLIRDGRSAFQYVDHSPNQTLH